MHLVQVLLPLYDNDGERLPRSLHDEVRHELASRYGGLTAYTRAPAEGVWSEGPEGTARDDIVIYEVMADELDRTWWAEYRQGLETRFRQRDVIVRAQAIERL